MGEIDKRNKLHEGVFSYKVTKDGKVFLSWHGKVVKTLKGAEARDFLEDIDGADDWDIQLVIAKITGNFKHGNERLAQNKQRFS